MNSRRAARVILLGVVCTSLCSTSLVAQSPTEPPNCPLSPSQVELLRQLSHEDGRQQVVIDAVEFDGSIHLPDSARQKLIAELKAKTFFADEDWPEKVEDDARWAWQDAGYFAVVVEAMPQFLSSDTKGQRFSVALHVQEGDQFRLGDLRIVDAPLEDRPSLRVRLSETQQAEGNRNLEPPPDMTYAGFPVEELRRHIGMKRGEVFSTSKIREGLEALKNLYGSKGYIDFTANPLTDIDQEDRLVNLTIQLDQEAQYRVRSVEVTGADPSIENQLRSMLRVGEPFDALQLNAFFKENSERLPPELMQRRLDFRRDAKTGSVDLRFDLRSCPATEN